MTAITDYVRGVRVEVKKITWPQAEDLRKTTVVIIIVVILLGILIGVMDFIMSTLLINWIPRLIG